MDRGVVAKLIGDHEIRLPIAVEIFGQNHARLHAGGNRVSSREIADSVSIVNVDLAGGDKSYCQIEFAIAVPVRVKDQIRSDRKIVIATSIFCAFVNKFM